MRGDSGQRRRARRAAATVLAALGLFCAGGCSGKASGSAAGGGYIVGIDEGGGGIRVLSAGAATGMEAAPASAAGKLQARSFVSLADAAWQWERSAPPAAILIGEAWARAHGMPSDWLRRIGRISAGSGQPVALAVVEGTAQRFLERQGGTALAAQLKELLGGWAASPSVFPGRPGALAPAEGDSALPFLSQAAADGQRTVRAVLFRKRQFAAVLSQDEAAWMACLRGGSSPLPLKLAAAEAGSRGQASPAADGLVPARCRWQADAGGGLRQPRFKLRVALEVEPLSLPNGTMPSPDAVRSAAVQGVHGLLRQLQAHGADPLGLGQALRSVYRGVWNPDRWREAWTAAETDVEVRVNIDGGVWK